MIYPAPRSCVLSRASAEKKRVLYLVPVVVFGFVVAFVVVVEIIGQRMDESGKTRDQKQS